MSLGNVIQELVVRIRYAVDNGGLEKANTSVRSLRRSIAALGIGAGLYKVGHTAFQTAAMLESAQAQFETMLGSKVAADKMMNDMWEYAAMSTFEMSDVTKAGTTLLNYGMTQEQVTDSMKRLGDVAGDSGPKFQRLALAYAQSFGKMRLTGEELRQFINAGANPLKAIADKHFKGNYAEAEEAMRKRKISFAMVEEALRSLTDKGGKFYQNQLKQSKTLTGVYTTMTDRLKATLAKMVMAFSKPLKTVMVWIGNINFQTVIDGVQWLAYAVEYLARQVWGSGLREGWKAFQEGLQAVGLYSGRAGGATTAFGTTLQALGKIVGAVLGYVLKMAAFWMKNLAPAMEMLIPIMREVGGAILGVVYAVQWLLTVLYDLLTNFLIPIGAALAYLWGLWQVGAAVLAGFSAASGGFAAAFASIGTAVETLTGLLPLLITQLGLVLSPFVAIAAAALSIGWAVYRIKKAVDEKEQRDMKENEDEARGQIEDELNKRSKALREARASGDKKRIEVAYKRWKALRDNYMKDWVNKKEDEDFGDMSYEAFIRQQTENSDKTIKKQVDGSGKTTNINQKVDFKVNVEGDKNAKSGLTAADVALLAERASRATFSLELERVLGAAL